MTADRRYPPKTLSFSPDDSGKTWLWLYKCAEDLHRAKDNEIAYNEKLKSFGFKDLEGKEVAWPARVERVNAAKNGAVIYFKEWSSLSSKQEFWDGYEIAKVTGRFPPGIVPYYGMELRTASKKGELGSEEFHVPLADWLAKVRKGDLVKVKGILKLVYLNKSQEAAVYEFYLAIGDFIIEPM